MAPISLPDTTSTLTLTQKQRTSLDGLPNQWDPYRILDVYPNDPDFTCMGIAIYSNARCRWQFYDVSIRRAACALLDMIATKHPVDVTRKSLESLAEKVLCYNHAKQMYDMIRGWEGRIEAFLGDGGGGEGAHGERSGDVRAYEEEIEKVRREMEGLRVERDEVQNRCTESDAEVAKLRTQQHQSMQRSERVEKRLKGKLVDSESKMQKLKEDARARLDEITFLNKLLTDSQTSAAAKAAEVQRLTGKLESSTQASERLESLQSEKIFNLNKRLMDRNAEIQRLEDTHRSLYRDKTEDSKRILELKQQNRQLKRHNHMVAFRNAVQRRVTQKRYERVVRENETLKEQGMALSGRLEEVGLKRARQDHFLSSLKLHHVKSGICAVLTTSPFRLSIRKVAKVREVED